MGTLSQQPPRDVAADQPGGAGHLWASAARILHDDTPDLSEGGASSRVVAAGTYEQAQPSITAKPSPIEAAGAPISGA